MNPLSPSEQITCENAISCNICNKSFECVDKKVRDHYPIWEYQIWGSSLKCNLKYKDPNFVPIIFHNLSGYDSHLFIKQLCSNGDKITFDAKNKEIYISFSKSIYLHDYINRKGELRKKYLQLRFIDSLKFHPGSLQNLADCLDETHFWKQENIFLIQKFSV